MSTVDRSPEIKVGERAVHTVKVLCAERGMSFADLTRELGTSPSYIRDCLRGYRPGSQIPTRVADFLNVAPADLYRQPVVGFVDWTLTKKEQVNAEIEDHRYQGGDAPSAVHGVETPVAVRSKPY